MKFKEIWACLVSMGALQASAMALPQAGQDYYSLQIASGKDTKALEKIYRTYTHLPYVRIEKRGDLYVLRAGFWANQPDALAAVTKARVDATFIRTAAFRPDTIVQHNWGEATKPETRKTAEMSSPNEVLRPFNQEDSTLAYDVLLGGGDLERAFRVAQQAVQQLPKDRMWRLKLASVSEWTQRPVVAAEQWRALFQQGDHSDATVLAVLRLVPLLDDAPTVLQAWALRAKQVELTSAQWRDIFVLYENAVEPSKGSVFFETQFGQKKQVLLLEYAAQLAENAGEVERAESLYLQRSQIAPFSVDFVLRVVVSLMRRDRLPQALALMQTYESQVPADAAVFWRLLSQMAWELRAYETAQGAYQRFSQTSLATASDWSRLIFLVRQKHPDQAAGLALEAYRRFGALDQFVSAMGIYAEIGDMPAQSRALALLKSEDVERAEQQVPFLLIRARFHQNQKAFDLAWLDLRSALQKSPDEKEVILASIWFLIDQKRVQELPLVLRQYAGRAETDASFWLAFAAGSQALERHPEAVVWYAKEVRRTPEEPLLLLNYADALERVRSVGMSERIRRHAWLLLKQKYRHLENLQGASQSQELLVLARLAILNQPGDPSLQWVRQWVNQMREGSTPQADEQLKVLVLGWAIVREQFVNARSWMWLRYAQQSQTAAPLWGQSQVALQLGDTEALQQLLSNKGPELPIYNRYDTAYALGNVQQALDISFQGMSQPAGDEPLYDRFRQHVPLHANYVQVRSAVENTGALDTQGLHFETRLIPHPNLHFVLGWSQQQQSSNDAHLAALALNADRLDSIQARWLGRRGDTVLTLFRHNEWQATTGLRLQQALQWGGRVSLEAGLDVRTDSSVSVPLRIAGYENSVSASINYTLGKREYVRAAPRWTRYYTQSGDYLGSGRIVDLEAGYRFRTEYPDWRVRAFVTQQQFFRDASLSASSRDKLPAGLQASIAAGEIDPLAFFLPESSTTLGSCVSMGENLAGQNIQTLYSRAWRPFMDFCLNHNTLSGGSYTGNVGLVGSITGEDHMSLQWQNSNSTAPGGSPTQSLSMRYRHYF